ncbi:MAG: DUF2089 domain-containing protein [Candidatus Tectomicrobia bacterium]|nr:DUF2089 domain-containing protein [Candidatus Tectomicrobia bacterium]
MLRKMLERCPGCGNEIIISRLSCQACGTTVEGKFAPCRFCRLDEESLNFIETFVRNRGNIREVERELGISYPTVRSRLEGIIGELGGNRHSQRHHNQAERERRRKEILDQVARKELSPAEAAQLLERIE